MLQVRKYCKWCLFCVIFWPLRLWNGGDVNFLINIMFVGILFWGRKVGLHVKRQKEWYIYISCLEQVFKRFTFSNEETLRTKSEMGPLTNHHLSRFYNKRKTTWSGAVYIWAASYWGESRNLLEIIDKRWRPLVVKNPCFSRHLDRHDIATFAIQLVNIKLQKAFGFDKYYQQFSPNVLVQL